MKTLAIGIWNKHNEKILITSDQVLVSGSNFIIGILISKLLGLGELGVYAFIWMILMMCGSIQQNFISIPMVNRYVEIGKDQTSQYLFNLFFLQILLSVLMSGILILLTSIPIDITFFNAIAKYGKIIPFLVFSYLMQDFTRRLFILKGELYKLVLIDFIVNWGQVFFLILMINGRGITLEYLLIIFSIFYIGGAIFVLFEFLKGKVYFSEIGKILFAHWRTAKWLIAAAVLQWFTGNYFIVSAGTLLGLEATGIIRIAQSVVGILNVFFIALEFYVPAKAAYVYAKKGKKALVHYMFRILVLGGIACLLFVVFIFFVSNDLLNYLYGKDYEKYSSIIIGFSSFYVIVFLGFPLRFVLRAMNNTKDVFWAYSFATAFSLLMSDIIISHFGVGGVVVGLALTQIIMQIWYVVAIVRTKPKESFI